MNDLERRIMENRLSNIDNRIGALEVEFIDYVETNPKTDEQWTEARLRALESQIKQLTEILNLRGCK